MTRFILSGALGQKALSYELNEGRQVLGRSSKCDIELPDAAVSMRHAEIEVQGTKVVVRDLGSRNGTFVNHRSVTGDCVLSPRDMLRVGHLMLRVKDLESSTVSTLAPESATASSISTSIDEAKSRASAAEGGRSLTRALHEFGQLLSRHLPMDQLYETQIEHLARFIRADRIILLDTEADRDHPGVLASRVVGGSPDGPIRISRTMLNEVLEHRRSFLTKDASLDDRLMGKESVDIQEVHTAMAAPLFDNDRILGIVYLDSRDSLVSYGSRDLELLTLLANMMAVKITNTRLEETEKQRQVLLNELEVAMRIQRNLLPGDVPDIPGYEMFAYLETCDQVGGDLYDFHQCADGRWWLVLGDVAGHGIPAALLMATTMALLQTLCEGAGDPIALVERLNRHVGPHVTDGRYVTLFLALLDPASGTVQYVNAGHPPAILVCDSERRRIKSTGIPVAMPLEVPWSLGTCHIRPGETLLVYSDGVTEATGPDDRQYDQGRFDEFLSGAYGKSAEALGQDLLEDVRLHQAGLPPIDDLTLLVFKRT